jgi:hypothetical protein
MINLLVIVMQREKYLRMRQRNALKLVNDMAHLYRVTF